MKTVDANDIKKVLVAHYKLYRVEEEAAADKNSSSKTKSRSAASSSTAAKGEQCKADKEVETRLRFLRRLHNGFPTFEQPDPGVGFECWHYSGYICPVVRNEDKNIEVSEGANPVACMITPASNTPTAHLGRAGAVHLISIQKWTGCPCVIGVGVCCVAMSTRARPHNTPQTPAVCMCQEHTTGSLTNSAARAC